MQIIDNFGNRQGLENWINHLSTVYFTLATNKHYSAQHKINDQVVLYSESNIGHLEHPNLHLLTESSSLTILMLIGLQYFPKRGRKNNSLIEKMYPESWLEFNERIL